MQVIEKILSETALNALDLVRMVIISHRAAADDLRMPSNDWACGDRQLLSDSD